MPTAAATVVTGALQYRAGREAATDQRRATQQAIAMEQQREAERQRRATEKAEQRRMAFLNYYDRYGDEAINRYGIPAGIDPGILPTPQRQSGRQRPAPAPQTPSVPGAQGMNIGRLTGLFDSQQPGPGVAGPQFGPQGPQGPTIGDLSGWADWRRYGARQ